MFAYSIWPSWLLVLVTFLFTLKQTEIWQSNLYNEAYF